MEVTGWPWLLLVAAWLAFLIPLLWHRVRAQDDLWPAWTLVLVGETEARYDYLREVFEGNAELVEAFLGEIPTPGAVERTRESTTWGLIALDGFVVTARERLAEWQDLARVIEAEIPGPLPRLRSGDYRLQGVRRLVRAAALRALLAPPGARCLSRRLFVLERAFAIVGRGGSELAARMALEAWSVVRSRSVILAHDFKALSQEALASARALLAALERS